MITEVSRAEQIRLEWRRGRSPTELAREYSISRQAVHQDIGGQVREGRAAELREIFLDPYWNWDEVQKVLGFVREGRKTQEIATQLGRDRETISSKRKELLERGIAVPPPTFGIALNDPNYILLGEVLGKLLDKKPRTLDLVYDSLKERDFVVYKFRRGVSEKGDPWFCYFMHRSEILELHELITERPDIIRSRTWSGRKISLG